MLQCASTTTAKLRLSENSSSLISPLGNRHCSNSATQLFNDSIFDEVPSANEIAKFLDSTSASAPGNIYSDIVASLTISKLNAIAEIIRIELN